jgi:hypothetical protein
MVESRESSGSGLSKKRQQEREYRTRIKKEICFEIPESGMWETTDAMLPASRILSPESREKSTTTSETMIACFASIQ